MRRIDELHLEFSFAGARMMARLLGREGHAVGCRRARTLMKRMGLEALYCKPNTSRRNTQHKIWPYLLRGMKIDWANQVFALDTTYIPMARGVVYLTLDGGGGLGEPQDSRAPGCHHTGGFACRGGAGRSICPLWAARRREYRSGQSGRARSPMPCWADRSACRWTAKVPRATTCSSNGCGEASSTKRSTRWRTSRSTMPGTPSANTSIYIIGNGSIRVWRIRCRVRHTSRCCLEPVRIFVGEAVEQIVTHAPV
ncbi:putative transposase [Paraburkholderia caballeronis]|nr:putative transposase [Paraburkholderia caballeronis]TDV07954.1 putative transposase [Paraburkholderia caballeronis]TDV18245.1 putative transposase [Paraburkholderia caballeronis]